MPCTFDPTTIDGAIGMMHCPECGEMIMAGLPHVDWDAPMPDILPEPEE